MNQWVNFTSFAKGKPTSGNICQVYGVPVEWIAIFPKFDPETQYLDGNIVLDYQKTWFKFSPGASGKVFEETTKQLKGRAYWEQKISFPLFWQSGPQHVKLNNMANHRWVFLFKESTGIYYVVGKPGVGAVVNIDYTNQQGTVTKISASAQSLHRAPLYTGVNQSMYRFVDEDGNFIYDEETEMYLGAPGPIAEAPEGTIGEFAGYDFTDDEFYVS